MRLAGLRVLITGAASGFGRMAAERFAAEGARLLLADLDGDAATALASSFPDAGAITADVSAEADHIRMIAACADRFGGLDIALNNAGVIHDMAPIPETPVEEFDRMMAVNARGIFLGLKHQMPLMAEAGGGCILNTASAAGLVGAGMFGAYAASKHAVVGLTRAAADEYARKGVRVNAICPSFAVSPMLEGIADGFGASRGEARGETYARLSGRVPMRRVATTEEVVEVMLMLCDPANTFMTGQCVAVDGGLTAV